ncbi:MAG: hypothetical protein ACXAES_11165 [Promethearchaeota archaeon]
MTGENLDTIVYGILSYMWAPVITILATYIGAELIIPKRKWILVGIYIPLGLVFEFSVFFNTTNSFTFSLPISEGAAIMDARIIIPSPAFLIMMIYLLGGWILNGFGFFFKGYRSEGVIRKKYYFLSMGFNIFIVFTILEVLLSPGFFIIFVRIGMISSTWFWFLGLRKEPEKSQQTSEKEIEVAESLFRLSVRPEHISEEEITFHKEKKICLVCKTNVSRVMYACPGCDALYCIKCSVSLSNLENACWVCNTPFDESMPSKPYEKIKVRKLNK